MIDPSLILETERTRLEPLREAHLEHLAIAGNDPALWELTYNGNPFTNPEDVRTWYRQATNTPAMFPFTIIDRASNTAIGSTRYFDVDEPNRKLEIGWTWIGRAHWRTHVNTECKYLLLRHAFENLGLNRVQLKGEAINVRSRAAMERIGATYEGTFRAFRVHPSGDIRDTSFYSIIAPEWPSVRARLEGMLARL